MKNNILISILSILFLITACTDLDQFPKAAASSDSLTEYGPVLNAAYGYHADAAAPMAVFGDFRSDNALFDETPFTDFANFSNNNLTSSMSNDFFQPFYRTLYKSILSANGVIENSTNATHVGEAKFLRALSYYKLIQVFGDVTVNLSASPDISDASVLVRQAKSSVYTSVVIPDLQDAMSALDASSAAAAGGRATSNAAQALLGKVYAAMGDYTSAAAELGAVINSAEVSGISLQDNFADVFGSNNDLNSEIIFATQMSSAVGITGEIFTNWYAGANTKADAVDGAPISTDLIAAFAASEGDIRTSLTLDGTVSSKYASGSATDQDWIEIRLADVILLYAEALNENGNSAGAVTELNKIRARAGLGESTASSQTEVRQAILDERRLELACEGHRWFDLQRANAANPGMLDSEMGQTINTNYYLFPIPITEVTSFDEIVQNPGY